MPLISERPLGIKLLEPLKQTLTETDRPLRSTKPKLKGSYLCQLGALLRRP